MLTMIGGGVPFGAPTPTQALASYPGRKSLMDGTFGSADWLNREINAGHGLDQLARHVGS
jgi:hypothetical protein